MQLRDSDLQHLAKLASVSLSPEEQESLRQDLESILGYVEKLFEAPTEGVEPTSHLMQLSSAARDDIKQESLPQKTVENIATDFAHGGFRVPRVL